MSTTIKNYASFYEKIERKSYPQEWIVRIFFGKYPNLKIDEDLTDKSIVEISCGDGRNLQPLIDKGLDVTATEVSEKIITPLQSLYPEVSFFKATNDKIPFRDEQFDFLLSWNSIYYMGNKLQNNINDYIKEYSRILKKKGVLIASVPMKDNFIFQNSIKLDDKYCKIINDPFHGIRNGEIMRVFKSEKDIEEEFVNYFENFSFAYSKNNHFGIQNNWHIFICNKY